MPPRARRCVICHRLLGGGEDRWFPFCSERCKWVDLGRWLGEAYRIPEPAAAAEPQPTGGRERGEGEPRRRRGNSEGESAVEEADG
ncbi:MAG: DNA gyrase inhibitor YacG [candidate division NC10 bacterium]|nr:DNA gyrase inhibitor YacG [candidate division NC10 bacterium]